MALIINITDIKLVYAMLGAQVLGEAAGGPGEGHEADS